MRSAAGPLLPWLMWALGAALYCYAFFQRIAPGVMVGELMRDLAIPAGVLGNLSAIYFYVYAALQMPAGLLLDRYGARAPLTIACGFVAGGSVVFALAPDVWTAYLGRFLVGIGAAFGWVGSLKVIAEWFPPMRFAMLSGLTLALGLAGGLVAQAPLALAVETFGWRATMLAGAGFGLMLAPAIALLLRERRREGTAPPRALNLLQGIRLVAAKPQCWILALVGMTLNATVNGFIGLWGVPYLATVYGFDRAGAALAASLVVVGWAVGSPIAGWLSDRVHRRRTPILVGTGIASMALGLIVFGSLPVLLVWPLLLIYGLSCGVTVIAYAAGRELLPPEASGAAVGFANTVAVFGIALLQAATGGILDLVWDGALHDGVRVYGTAAYASALAVYPLLVAAGHLLAYASRETYGAR